MPRWEIPDGKKGQRSALHFLAVLVRRDEAGTSNASSCYHMLDAAAVGVSMLNSWREIVGNRIAHELETLSNRYVQLSYLQTCDAFQEYSIAI